MTLTAGTGVILVGSPGLGYTISTIDTFTQEKTAEDPPEQKNADTPEETFKSGSGSTIASSGGLAGALGGLGGVISIFGGGAGISGIASSAIGAVGGLSGALTGGSLVGGFIGIWGHERKQEIDEDDNGLYNEDGTASLEEGSNVVIATLPDALGCDTTRLLFDKPPPCSWLGLQNEYGHQAVNLQILREYDTEIIIPKIVETTSELLEPLLESIDLTTALVYDLDLISDTPNLSGYAVTANLPATYVSHTSLSSTLLGYVNNTAFATGMALKHPLITTSSKLDFSLLSNVPSFVAQSVYDARQLVIDTALPSKQNTIANSVSLSGVDTTSTTLLNENFNSGSPSGVLTGNALYDSTNKWVQALLDS
ncbi:hypothetical protein DFS34DRAFT_645838 [Phlyctochytrium arcticum]|nr:hypothetical protein DFS34DRAFT_645838 [Phlyctochytrium arcticum]